MPPALYPPTIYFNSGDNGEFVISKLKEAGFDYPLIGKPDIGGRGRGVKILHTDEDVIEYCKTAIVEFHIQKFVPFKNETGIFYYRYPGSAKGKLSGIVRKEFLSVTGDGRTSIRELLKKEQRSFLHLHNLEEMYGDYLDSILETGEEKIMVPYGNHARGAKFLDDSHLIDEQLTNVIDNACQQVKDFYYGRLDVRYNTWEELKQGKNFCIIEVNGAGSEPTHMYDPKHSLFFAWKEIIRHWILLWRISRMNHHKGHKYLSFKEGVDMFRYDKEHSKKLAQMPA